MTTATYPIALPIWCAGCGHFGVQAAMAGALRELEIPPHETMVLAGIGCSGTVQNNLGTYGYHALHGRVLPAAAGVHLANPELTVIAAGGDGDGYAIGMGHLVHTLRRNPSFTYVVMNNGVYGLTKGQNSPSYHRGADAIEFDAISLALSIPATTFVARGFARWSDQMLRLMVAAVDHARQGRGFAFIEVLSPCVTYNDSYAAWEASLVDVDQRDDHDASNRLAAFQTVGELDEAGHIPVGLIYQNAGQASDTPPVNPFVADLDPAANAEAYQKLMARFSF